MCILTPTHALPGCTTHKRVLLGCSCVSAELEHQGVEGRQGRERESDKLKREWDGSWTDGYGTEDEGETKENCDCFQSSEE